MADGPFVVGIVCIVGFWCFVLRVFGGAEVDGHLCEGQCL